MPTARDCASDIASWSLLVKRSIRMMYLPVKGRSERWTAPVYEETCLRCLIDKADSGRFKRSGVDGGQAVGFALV
ncbi:hypothetical protein CWR53_22975 [Pseudomonas sp. SGAir0191]|nr:hypothetical protein CWR53_22975 [Pseudomonas sp. SGAir0191]